MPVRVQYDTHCRGVPYGGREGDSTSDLSTFHLSSNYMHHWAAQHPPDSGGGQSCQVSQFDAPLGAETNNDPPTAMLYINLHNASCRPPTEGLTGTIYNTFEVKHRLIRHTPE